MKMKVIACLFAVAHAEEEKRNLGKIGEACSKADDCDTAAKDANAECCMTGTAGPHETTMCALKSISGVKDDIGGVEYSYVCSATTLALASGALFAVL